MCYYYMTDVGMTIALDQMSANSAGVCSGSFRCRSCSSSEIITVDYQMMERHILPRVSLRYTLRLRTCQWTGYDLSTMLLSAKFMLELPKTCPTSLIPSTNCVLQTLLALGKLDPWLMDRLFTAVKAPDQEGLSLESLVMAMALCLKVFLSS